MKVGLAGRPGSGKSTLFQALTGVQARPGGREETRQNLGVIKVPDRRIEELAKIFKPKKVVFAEISLVDFALPGTAKAGEVFFPALLNRLKEIECLALVLAEFDHAPASSLHDLEEFESEMKLADLQIIENRLARFKKEKGSEGEKTLLEELKSFIESDRSLRERKWTEEELGRLSGFGFLSLKPLLVLVNVEEGNISSPLDPKLTGYLESHGLLGIAISAKLEMELSGLTEEERAEFLRSLGLETPARDRFIEAMYAHLDLVSFLTVGGDEVRAWPIPKGITALKAAGKVHSDIERGFIRAEVISYEDFMAYGSEAKCREVGKLRVEGKEYVVRDGDIVHFRFKV